MRNWSRSFNDAARRYCTTRRELVTAHDATIYFRPYLWGRLFILRTDHASLQWLYNFKNPTGVISHWVEAMAEFDFVVVHRAGKSHANADTMSRLPGILESMRCPRTTAKRPCFKDGCKVCANFELKGEFCEFQVDPDKDYDPDGPTNFQRSEIKCLQQQSNKVFALADRYERVSVADREISWQIFSKVDEFADSNFAILQQEDKIISPLYHAIANGEDKPTYDEISSLAPEYKLLCRDWDRFVIKDGVLYRRWFDGFDDDGDRIFMQRIVPFVLRENVLAVHHNSLCAGHPGRDRMLPRLRVHFYWPGIKSSVALFIARCEMCQRRKAGKIVAKAPMVEYRVGAPFERIAMDLMGPLPKAKGPTPYRYIMVVGCYFSKWVEAIPIVDKKAETIARACIDGIFTRYGCPFELHTDRGTEFENEIMDRLCEYMGINKTKTTSRHPQSDGMVERANRSILDMLAKHVDKIENRWNEYLQLVMSAYRCYVHAATGFTPNRMMFGRELIQPQDIKLGAKKVKPVSSSDYVNGIERELRRCHEIAREVLKERMHTAKRYYDRNAQLKEYHVSDAVLAYNPIVKVGVGKKFILPWEGPFVITKKYSPLTFVIEAPRKRPRTVHHNKLKPYRGELSQRWFLTRRKMLYKEGIGPNPLSAEFIAREKSDHPIEHSSVADPEFPRDDEDNGTITDAGSRRTPDPVSVKDAKVSNAPLFPRELTSAVDEIRQHRQAQDPPPEPVITPVPLSFLDDDGDDEDIIIPRTKRGRGRLPGSKNKKKTPQNKTASPEPTVKRKRGRPRKNPQPAPATSEDETDTCEKVKSDKRDGSEEYKPPAHVKIDVDRHAHAELRRSTRLELKQATRS